MSNNFYFKSLKFENYRGIESCSIDNLRRVNIIGGLNGSGKTTFLEALFFIIDRKNPSSAFRPYYFRGISIPYPDALKTLIGLKHNTKAKLSALTTQGFLSCEISGGKPLTPLQITTDFSQSALQFTGSTVDPSVDGLNVHWSIDGVSDDITFAWQPSFDQTPGVLLAAGLANKNPPYASFFSPSVKNGSIDDAQRYSKLWKDNRISEIVEIIKILSPEVIDLVLLQDGAHPSIYAKMSDGRLVQMSLLGSGAQFTLSLALTIASGEMGVLLMDEIDSSIHFSKLVEYWKFLLKFANLHNCQIFSATHSKECISAALEAADEIGHQSDLSYLRFDRFDGETEVTQYFPEELASALAGNWEVR